MKVDETIRFIRKICLVGDPAVGKTSLVKRYVLDTYDDSYIATIGAKVMKKDVDLQHEGNSYRLSLMLWDVMGQNHFRIIQSVAFQHAVGGLIVCDITRKETFDKIDYWVEALTRVSGRIPLIILANKSDLASESQITEEMLREKASKFDFTYFMTSARTGQNVEEAFLKLAKYCLMGVDNG